MANNRADFVHEAKRWRCVDHICEIEAANRIVDNAVQSRFI